MTENLTHHEFTAEWTDDEHGKVIMLTQQHEFDDPHSVILHPGQLLATCEHFGIIATDPQAAKTIATLKRRLLALRERVETMHDWLCNHSDHKHADLTWEVTFATATVDIANEFCADFEDSEPPAAKPTANPMGSQSDASGLPAETYGDKQTSLI